jgi:hypothetical protein
MAGYEHHSISVEPMDGGSVVTESHHVDGMQTMSKRFVSGKTPSKDLKALVAQGPSESGTDGVGSKGMKGAKAWLGHL